ncbi:MAG TPA: MBL fold metallo-hydrolase [Mycobacteriales bacterium]|jgi:cyclase|nr:MBL fold metallo-hydrolase [Mycobacteriales bacterium]
MSGHGHEPLAPAHTVEVADGVFAYIQPDGSWWLNNTGFVRGSAGTVAIDATSTERRTRALLAAMEEHVAAPVRTLVNTHHHGDHTNGNCLFTEANVIGHRNCREGVRAQVIGGLEPVFGAVDWGDLQIRPPTVVFDDRLDVYAGDRRIELHFIGTPAHTTGDVVAWLPDDGVLFAGDLVFNGGTPFVLMGSVDGAIEACERVRAFGATTIVPGHGEVCGPETIDAAERYLRFVRDVAARAVADGLSPLQAAQDIDLGEFAELHDRERIVGNLHRAMFELGGAERGAQIDVLAAFGDMLTYNGGGPLRCLA